MDTNKDLQEQRHPSALSADELEALKASDPTAFDEDEDEGEAAADTPDPELLKAVAGDEAPAAAAAADDGDADGGTVDKRAFNGLLAELRQTREELKAVKQAQEASAAAAPAAKARDFEAELRDLRNRYENEGELSDEEYDAARASLLRDQVKLEVQQEFQQEAAKHGQAQAQAAWQERIAAWEGQHADFLANTIRRNTVSNLFESLGADASLSDDELIKRVEKEAFEAFNYQPKTAAAAPAAGNPHAQRNATDAAAASAASAAPPPPSAGTGNRGGPDSGIDLTAIKQGDFSKLPKAEQEKLLGEGALD